MVFIFTEWEQMYDAQTHMYPCQLTGMPQKRTWYLEQTMNWRSKLVQRLNLPIVWRPSHLQKYLNFSHGWERFLKKKKSALFITTSTALEHFYGFSGILYSGSLVSVPRLPILEVLIV